MRQLVLTALAAAIVLVACGGERPGRVLVLGLDGFDPQTVDLLLSEGKLPNLARMRQQGAYGRLESREPLLSPIVWTTIATGKEATEHGIGHFIAVEPDGTQVPATSDMRRVKALWTIASENDRTVATVGYWATWPPEPVNGVVVSDHTAYHFLFDEGLNPSGEDGAAPKTYPPEVEKEIAPWMRRPQDIGAADLAPFVDVPAADLEKPFDFTDDLAHFRWALATAQSYSRIGLELWRSRRPALEMVYIEATDSSAHLFGHLFRAEGLSGELAEQQKRYGHAVEAMYLYADEIVGRYLDALDDDTTMVVLSDHGFQLGKLNDDPTKTRDMRRVSEVFHRLHGVLYLYGNKVKHGARIDNPSIFDVAPTVLTLLGLAPAKDMPGRVLTEATDVAEPPRVATYETGGERPTQTASRDTAADQALTEHLQSLGYLEGGSETGARSPRGDRNLAAILFEDGRYRESAQLYHALVESDPDDASLRTSLAGALGALGRYDEALVELEKSIELEPLNVEAYHNRAVLEERRGDAGAAIEDYRRVLRYQPSYEPSAKALVRLTGSAEPRVLTPAQREAMAVLDQAASAARRGDYPGAAGLLDAAEAHAPGFVLVYQYRANVAYLAGDRPAAIRALERALEIEPDNALFRNNLEKLKSEGKGSAARR